MECNPKQGGVSWQQPGLGQDGSRAGISLSGMVCVGRKREEQGCRQERDSAGARSQENDL